MLVNIGYATLYYSNCVTVIYCRLWLVTKIGVLFVLMLGKFTQFCVYFGGIAPNLICFFYGNSPALYFWKLLHEKFLVKSIMWYYFAIRKPAIKNILPQALWDKFIPFIGFFYREFETKDVPAKCLRNQTVQCLLYIVFFFSPAYLYTSLASFTLNPVKALSAHKVFLPCHPQAPWGWHNFNM